MVRTRARARRSAFTFIELLFVIAIIAVLIALLLGAVTRVLQLQGRTEVLTDITKMQQSLGAAKRQYNDIEHLPSQLIFYTDITQYRRTMPPMTALERQTAQVFRHMFGKRFIDNGLAIQTVNWGFTIPPGGYTMQGSECLVFYLGGMVQNGKCIGFSTNATDPTAAPVGQGSDRKGPFYEFRANRLALLGLNYPSYLDPYGSPYLFFGALSPNTYNPDEVQFGVYAYRENDYAIRGGTDAPGTPIRWLNPNTFQIISAGRDKTFTTKPNPTPPPATWPVLWNPTIGTPGSDDLANFSQTELGNSRE